MHTPLPERATALLGCRLPIVLAGMGGVSRAELVAAVSRAGGFGFLGMVREPPALIRREVETLRQLGIGRFGVNIIPAATPPALLAQQIDTIIDLHVPVVALFWDIDDRVVVRFRDAGINVVYQVGTVADAVAAEQAGAGMIIAQGVEAGGHVWGREPLRRLLPAIAAKVRIPVLAAGGLGTGGDLVTAMALGADGIVLGTALIAAAESFAHAFHKARLLEASAGDTVLTDIFSINWPPGAAVRVLRSDVTKGARGHVAPDERVVIGEEEGRPIFLFSTNSPLRSMTGDFAAMALYAGTGVGRVQTVEPAAKRLTAIAAEADRLLALTTPPPSPIPASAVCYAGEMGGAYFGQLEPVEIPAALAPLAADLRHELANALETGAGPDAPPFADAAFELAAWTFAVRSLAVQSSDVTAGRPLARLGNLIPTLPEGKLRERLLRLRAFLEARAARDILAARRASAAADSGETLAASDR
jgi:nitronate monooxygenase